MASALLLQWKKDAPNLSRESTDAHMPTVSARSPGLPKTSFLLVESNVAKCSADKRTDRRRKRDERLTEGNSKGRGGVLESIKNIENDYQSFKRNFRTVSGGAKASGLISKSNT